MSPDTTNWDRSRSYISKNNDEVWIFIPATGEWKQFFAQEKISQLVDAGITAYQNLQLQKDKK